MIEACHKLVKDAELGAQQNQPVSLDPMPDEDGVDEDEHVTPHLDVLGQEGHWSEKDIQARASADVLETERGSFVPERMVWPQSWHALIGCIRGLACPVFWEMFAGACVMTGAFSDAGWQTAPPLDVLIDATMNLFGLQLVVHRCCIDFGGQD